MKMSLLSQSSWGAAVWIRVVVRKLYWPGVDVLEAGEDVWAAVADAVGSDVEQVAGVGLQRVAEVRQRGSVV